MSSRRIRSLLAASRRISTNASATSSLSRRKLSRICTGHFFPELDFEPLLEVLVPLPAEGFGVVFPNQPFTTLIHLCIWLGMFHLPYSTSTATSSMLARRFWPLGPRGIFTSFAEGTPRQCPSTLVNNLKGVGQIAAWEPLLLVRFGLSFLDAERHKRPAIGNVGHLSVLLSG